MSAAGSSRNAVIISLRNSQKNWYEDSAHFSLNTSRNQQNGGSRSALKERGDSNYGRNQWFRILLPLPLNAAIRPHEDTTIYRVWHNVGVGKFGNALPLV